MKHAPAIFTAYFGAALLGWQSKATILLDFEPKITAANDVFTGCTSCLADSSMKYCVTENLGIRTEACCSINDFQNALCNSRLQGVTCSDSIGLTQAGASA